MATGQHGSDREQELKTRVHTYPIRLATPTRSEGAKPRRLLSESWVCDWLDGNRMARDNLPTDPSIPQSMTLPLLLVEYSIRWSQYSTTYSDSRFRIYTSLR
jgi:hypothetical protein